MKLLKKTLKPPTRICDKCGKKIKPDERALGFHGEDEGQEYETFLCESCITAIYNEYLKEMEELGG